MELKYPAAILTLSAVLVYGTTTLGAHAVGSDIQREFLSSNLALQNGWNVATTTEQSNTSIIVGVLAPALAHVFDMETVYKWILPLFLIAMPVVLYQVFRLQIGSLKAFFTTVFFIIVPVFNLEVGQIVKMMAAEFFFALMLLVMVLQWPKPYQKTLLVTVLLTLVILSHYTVGLAALAYLLGITLLRFLTPLFKLPSRMPVWSLATCLVMGIAVWFAYYSYADNGEIVKVMTGVRAAYAEPTSAIWQSVSSPMGRVETAIEQTTGTYIYLYGQEKLVQTGIGLDFFETTVLGKAFRIVQYLTQVLIVAGAVWLWRNRKQYKFSAEFIAGIGCSFLLLLCCIFVPTFSNTINMTRFYHISLFFLAPMLVIAFDIGKKHA